jgi:CRP-like cAMP-binding protein
MEERTVLSDLWQIPMFRNLGEEGDHELLRLAPYLRARTYAPGERLLNGNRAPDRTILILSGTVAVRRSLPATEGSSDAKRVERDLGERGPGAVLGRTSLIADDFDYLTVEALEATEVRVIFFRDLIRAYQNSPYLRAHVESPLKPERLVNRLRTIPLFQQLSGNMGDLELYRVAQIVQEQYYDDEEWVFRQGEISDRLIKVVEGRIQLSLVDADGFVRDVDVLEPGAVVGETGFLVGDFHDVTATARGHARVLYIMRTEFAQLLNTRPYLERQLNISAPVAKLLRLRLFEWLRGDEWVMEIAQRHWTRLVRLIALPTLVLLLLLPAILTLLLSQQIALMIVAGFLGLPLLALVALIAWQYFNWLDDYFVVTTQRVVHIERVWPRSTHLDETPLHSIENIFELQPDIFANLLNYGTLVLQTAGETVDVEMSYIPAPTALRRLIREQVERSRARDVLRTRGQVRDLLWRRMQENGAPESNTPPVGSGTASRRSEPAFSPLIMLLVSIRDFFFPPATIKLEGGHTIIFRRYWLPGLRRYGLPLLAFLVGTIGGALFLFSGIARPALLTWLVTWLVLEAVLLGILMWFVEDWRNDYFQLTSTHIVHIERLPLLLQESRHEARLDRIQNLSYSVPTLVARIFKYGHVQFETASTGGTFILRYVRRPAEVQSTISNRQYQYRQRQRQMEAEQRQQELLTWFSTYDDLHGETRNR